jgi:hypothetical protein
VPWKPVRQIPFSGTDAPLHSPPIPEAHVPLRRPSSIAPELLRSASASGKGAQCLLVILVPESKRSLASNLGFTCNMAVCRRECPHYTCGIKVGRLTPCISKAFLSVKKPRNSHRMSANSKLRLLAFITIRGARGLNFMRIHDPARCRVGRLLGSAAITVTCFALIGNDVVAADVQPLIRSPHSDPAAAWSDSRLSA